MRRLRWFLGPLVLLALVSPVSAQMASAHTMPFVQAQHLMTPARAMAFVQAQHSAAEMSAALNALSPSDRQYVITYALTPRTLVDVISARSV